MKAIVITFKNEKKSVSDDILAKTMGTALIGIGVNPEFLEIGVMSTEEICKSLLTAEMAKTTEGLMKNVEGQIAFKAMHEDFKKYCDTIIKSLRKAYKNPKLVNFEKNATTRRLLLLEFVRNSELKNMKMLNLIKFPTLTATKILNEKHLEFLEDWIDDILTIYNVVDYDGEI